MAMLNNQGIYYINSYILHKANSSPSDHWQGYVMWKFGVPAAVAIRLIRAARPCIRPNVGFARRHMGSPSWFIPQIVQSGAP